METVLIRKALIKFTDINFEKGLYGLYIVIVCLTCNTKNQTNANINDSLNFKISIETVKLKSNNSILSKIVDSLKYYIYAAYYDKAIISDSGNGIQYFCFFQLKPFFIDSFPDYYIIQYALIDSKFKTLDVINVSYQTNNNILLFKKENIALVMMPFEQDIFLGKKLSLPAFKTFFNDHKSKIDPWFLNQLINRNING